MAWIWQAIVLQKVLVIGASYKHFILFDMNLSYKNLSDNLPVLVRIDNKKLQSKKQ
jgi:hypothetical protein